jgi:hypothetical protein
MVNKFHNLSKPLREKKQFSESNNNLYSFFYQAPSVVDETSVDDETSVEHATLLKQILDFIEKSEFTSEKIGKFKSYFESEGNLDNNETNSNYNYMYSTAIGIPENMPCANIIAKILTSDTASMPCFNLNIKIKQTDFGVKPTY